MTRNRLYATALMLIAVMLATRAQTVVSGIVADSETHQPLSHVSVSAPGDKEHTITNDEGRFVLKVKDTPAYVQLSHIGYKTQRQRLQQGSTENLRILLTARMIRLNEVVVKLDDPFETVKAAMSHITDNYPRQPELVRCFYRETVRRGSRYISVAEAVTDMYKTAYNRGPQADAVAILKGRRLMSLKARDTLGVKIQGGPVMPLVVDVAKNSDYLLNMEDLERYSFSMLTPTIVDDRLHYVVNMQPRDDIAEPLMFGKLFIDQQTLTISRAELQLNMTDWRIAADFMLVRKPKGMHFRPRELTVTIVYHTDLQGVTRMSYVRNELRFHCDWHRRLFAAPFTAVSEMVVTDRLSQGSDVKRPRGRDSFGMRDRFYDQVEYFNDPDFWAGYNIIEPTESLEKAIGKLKKKKQ